MKCCGRRSHAASAALLFILALSILSCKPAVTIVERPIDFSTFRDSPIPADAAEWLLEGPQTRITPAISTTAAGITGSLISIDGGTAPY